MGAESYDINKFNQVVIYWKNQVRARAKSNVVENAWKGKTGSFSRILGKKTEYKLEQHLEAKTRKDFGEINQVSFQFPRHGVFFHKGVGRGWEMINGKVIRTAKGIQKGIRVPVDWLNCEIDNSIEELADELAGIKADALINATRAKIK